MTREEIIQGLQFTIDMFLSDPLTGEPITKPRNDMDKTTIDACKGAIELLTQEPCGDAISREDALMCMTGEYIADMTYKPEDIISKHIQRLRALPSVQPKPVECEDAISMMDLLNNLHKHFSKGFETDEWWNSTHVLQAVKDCRPELFDLNYVSSVQPKPKTGQWVLLDECSNSGYYCSECHKKLVKEGWSGTVKKIKYCPNCGAKMVKPQESEVTE